jgi:hypothetical protein
MRWPVGLKTVLKMRHWTCESGSYGLVSFSRGSEKLYLHEVYNARAWDGHCGLNGDGQTLRCGLRIDELTRCLWNVS